MFDEKKFGDSLEQSTLEEFMLATPYASGERTALDNSITPKIFYEHFYANSNQADELVTKINNAVCHGNNNIIISGYKGCGKTTFINYFTQKTNHRSIMLNFDDYVDTGSDIKSSILLEIFRKILLDVEKNHGRIIKKLNEIYNKYDNASFFNLRIDSDNSYKSFFEYIKKLISLEKPNSVESINNELKTILGLMKDHQLLVILIFLDISNRICNNLNPKCYIVFENLDVINNNQTLADFTRDVSAFRNNINYILSRITYPGLTENYYNPFQEYTLIFCMRETTKAEFIEHFHDRGMTIYDIDDVSRIYDKKTIIDTRFRYLLKLINEQRISNGKLLKQCEQLSLLLDDAYISENMFSLFDYDFRTSISVLCRIITHIGKSKPQIFDSIKKLRDFNTEDNWSIHASRSIVLREVFNIFIKHHYIDTILASEYKPGNNNMAINVTRILLLYLLNNKHYYQNNQPIEGQPTSLYNVLNDMTQYFDGNLIINSIWNLYELRNKKYWNHLITFDGFHTISYDALSSQLSKFKNNEINLQSYGKVGITYAGQSYLEIMLPRYEFFAARRYSDERSLFTLTKEELSNTGHLDVIFSGVFSEVKSCCERLKRFYFNIFYQKHNITPDEYLRSDFVWCKYSDFAEYKISMFHSERIIHSHIGYLNDFRMFAFYVITDEKLKAKINELVIKYIKNYIALFDIKNINNGSALYSNHSLNLIKLYEKCIDKIKKAKYYDFTTNIDSDTGKDL